ncbi:MAG: DUF1302 domain-containing protein [Pseudomonadales bacterium]|nr:DUF1302 domain-containing protein [Pseudomonadales bacterium]
MIKPINGFTQGGFIPAFAKILGTGALLSLPLSSQAVQFQFDDPNTQAFIDTTVSLGAIFRGVDASTPPATYGDINFPDKGELVSTPLKITVEGGFQKGSFGVFMRGTYIYDAIIMGLDPTTSVPTTTNDWITADGQDEIGNSFRLLDAFVYGSVGLGGTTNLSGRLGNQVLSWGESTFIGNSLNSINPIDATKARGAAPELKEILLPLPIIWGSLDFGGKFSFDAYYVAKWEATVIDPVGTFFSSSAVAGEGFEEINQVGIDASSVDAEDGKEFGFAFRTVSESMGWAEFGLYYMRQSSHAPFLQATLDISGTPTPSYQLIYPEKINVFGVSFNVDLPGELGLSMAGEISYRPDVPMSWGATTFGFLSTPGSTAGYSEGDMTQLQTTFTYTGGSANPFGADKMSVLFEPGLVYANMPENTPTEVAVFGGLDRFSYGYVALIKLEYSDVFWNLTLEPAITYKQDIQGSGPGIPSATFVERRKSITAGVTATYLTSTTFDIGYTAYWGGGDYGASTSGNVQKKQDFLALTLKTSF